MDRGPVARGQRSLAVHVVILGTGALACVYAAHLAPHAPVTLLGTWGEALAAMALHGVQVERPDGAVVRVPVEVAGSPEGLPPASAVLVLVKSYQTERAAAWAARVLAPAGVALTLQNGLDNAARLAGVLGAHRVAAGVTYNAATLLGPGVVRHVALQPSYAGPAESPATGGASDAAGGPQACLSQLAALLTRAGLPTEEEPDIRGRLWGKAVVNAAINPLTALWRVNNGALLATAARRGMLASLAQEAAGVAAALGVTLPFADSVAQAEAVCRATAANRSSMLQDVERGRPTEIDSINGVIVAEAARLGVPASHNELVWRLVAAL